MITKESTLRQVYSHPVGKDIVNRLLASMNKSPTLIDNPIIGNLRLSAIDKLLGSKTKDLVDTIVSLLSSHSEAPPTPPASITKKWWKEAVVYQIYPRSFQDSNGDGIGDLNGIKQRIPYLKELGVDIVWLSPIYDSPNDDNGYDIRDYKKIMREFGNMTNFNALLSELHNNGMKLIMDLVINHTSDEHAWFKAAVKDSQSPYKDYYIWAKGDEKKGPPNNWTSFFSGEAWNYYPEKDEWAMHLFSKKQMDLNWENPNMRADVYEMINWWLEKGIDGFRLDVINLVSKGTLKDGSPLIADIMGVRGIEHFFYGPRLHEYLQEMHRETFSKYDVFTVGETPGMGIEMSKLLTAEERKELDLVFNFDAFDTPGNSRMNAYEYDLRHLKTYFTLWQNEYGNNCWPSLVFENHDNPRMPSKVTDNINYAAYISKLLAVLQLTLKGTPFIYQGQELGMVNTTFENISQMRDVEGINKYHELLSEHTSISAFETVKWGSRDHARTPMQWSASINAGFTEAAPWIDLNPNYLVCNAEEQAVREDSVLSFFKKLIALRKTSPALVYGEFNQVFPNEKNIFCYFRILGNEKFYIEINLTEENQKRRAAISDMHHLAASNYGDLSDLLRPYEANVYLCNET